MTPLREALALPCLFLTVALLGGLRLGADVRLVPPPLITLVLAVPAPAGADPAEPTSDRSTVRSIDPPDAPVEARVVGGDGKSPTIRSRNTTASCGVYLSKSCAPSATSQVSDSSSTNSPQNHPTHLTRPQHKRRNSALGTSQSNAPSSLDTQALGSGW